MNRLREVRKSFNITLKELSKQLTDENVLSVTPDTLAKYERSEREPKIQTWNRLAEFFEVSTSYLMGIDDDPYGWEQREKETGFSRTEIQNEIKSLINTHHLTGNEPYYSQIDIAILFLKGDGETDAGVQRYAVKQLNDLLSDVRSQYEDPNKIEKIIKELPKKHPTNKKITIGQMIEDMGTSATFYDDMDAKVYQQIHDILTDARNKINAIPTKK